MLCVISALVRTIVYIEYVNMRSDSDLILLQQYRYIALFLALSAVQQNKEGNSNLPIVYSPQKKAKKVFRFSSLKIGEDRGS